MPVLFTRAAKLFAVKAVRKLPRRLVFQRLPQVGETQTDARGFPVSTYTDISPSQPIPCYFASEGGHEVLIQGATRAVTLFKFEIPSLNYVGGQWFTVDFSPKYRVHLLANSNQNLPEMYFQIQGGGGDDDPVISFEAVNLEELV